MRSGFCTADKITESLDFKGLYILHYPSCTFEKWKNRGSERVSSRPAGVHFLRHPPLSPGRSWRRGGGGEGKGITQPILPLQGMPAWPEPGTALQTPAPDCLREKPG